MLSVAEPALPLLLRRFMMLAVLAAARRAADYFERLRTDAE